MIYGVGVDCVEIERMKKSASKETFLKKVFSEEENKQMQNLKQNRLLERATGLFAAKEAFLKAVGTGIGGFSFTEIVVQHKESGAPYFALKGKACKFCEDNKIKSHLSISHDGGVAIAFVMLEKL